MLTRTRRERILEKAMNLNGGPQTILETRLWTSRKTLETNVFFSINANHSQNSNLRSLIPDAGILDNRGCNHRHVNVYGQGRRDETTVSLLAFLLLQQIGSS
jgi:hypothetical protein